MSLPKFKTYCPDCIIEAKIQIAEGTWYPAEEEDGVHFCFFCGGDNVDVEEIDED